MLKILPTINGAINYTHRLEKLTKALHVTTIIETGELE